MIPDLTGPMTVPYRCEWRLKFEPVPLTTPWGVFMWVYQPVLALVIGE